MSSTYIVPVANPDLRGRGRGGGAVFFACPAGFFSFCIFSFLPKDPPQIHHSTHVHVSYHSSHFESINSYRYVMVTHNFLQNFSSCTLHLWWITNSKILYNSFAVNDILIMGLNKMPNHWYTNYGWHQMVTCSVKKILSCSPMFEHFFHALFVVSCTCKLKRSYQY